MSILTSNVRILAHVQYRVHCTYKGSTEELARPAFTEIGLPSLIACVRQNRWTWPALSLPCAGQRLVTEDMAAGRLGSPDNPIALDSDSDNEGSELSPLVLASPLAWSARLSPFKVTKSRLDCFYS